MATERDHNIRNFHRVGSADDPAVMLVYIHVHLHYERPVDCFVRLQHSHIVRGKVEKVFLLVEKYSSRRSIFFSVRLNRCFTAGWDRDLK